MDIAIEYVMIIFHQKQSELIDFTNSTAFVNASSVANAVNPRVVISGAWDKENAISKFVDEEGNSGGCSTYGYS